MRFNVWAEVCPYYGNAILLITNKLKEHAPSYVKFVDDWIDADIIIESVIGTPGRQNLVHPKERNWSDEVEARMFAHDGKLVYIAHCSIIDDDFFREAFEKSHAVIGFLDLAHAVQADYTYFRTPWGVDASVFYDRCVERIYDIYTWGCSSDPKNEGIKDIAAAIRTLNQCNIDAKMLHSGVDYKFAEACGYKYVPPAQDRNEVAKRLSMSKYANALREEEGFELMGIEGLLCGARPIYYDLPCYRHWFDGIGEFISPDPVKTEGDLVNLFSRPPREVTLKEKYEVINMFNWRRVCDNMWDIILG